MRPLPKPTRVTGVVEGYAQSNLDDVSLWNGVGKFCHSQVCGDANFTGYFFAVMDHFFPAMRNHSELFTEPEIAQLVYSSEHASKSSGFPFDALGYPTKARAYQEYGFDALLQMFDTSVQIIGATLKDELRPIGKDSRLFRPANLAAYVVGTMLFGRQNDYLMSRLLETPIFIKYVTPGVAITLLYDILDKFSIQRFDADGSQWDAHFQLWIAQLILAYRLRFLPPQEADRAQRYYSMMYNGYTSVGGWLFNLIGQPSGHTNTTIDNSIGHMCIMAYHAYRNGLTVAEFVKDVCFYTCGDDLVWADRTDLFTPIALDATYSSLGVFLEFGSLESSRVEELRFVSTRSVCCKFEGMSYRSYTYSYNKLKASLLLDRRKQKCIPHLSRLASICRLMFNDERYLEFREHFDKTVEAYVSAGTLSRDNATLCGLQEALEPHTILRAYTYWE